MNTLDTQDQSTSKSEEEAYAYQTSPYDIPLNVTLQISPFKKETRYLDFRKVGHYIVYCKVYGKPQRHFIPVRGHPNQPSEREYNSLEKITFSLLIKRKDSGTTVSKSEERFVRDATGSAARQTFEITSELCEAGGVMIEITVSVDAALTSRDMNLAVSWGGPKTPKEKFLQEYREHKRREEDFELTRSEFVFPIPEKMEPFLTLTPEEWGFIIHSNLNQHDCKCLASTCIYFYHTSFKYLQSMRLTLFHAAASGEVPRLLKCLTLKCPNLEFLELTSGHQGFVDRYFNYFPRNLRKLTLVGFSTFFPVDYTATTVIPKSLHALSSLQYLKTGFLVHNELIPYLPQCLVSLDCPFLEYNAAYPDKCPALLPSSLTSLSTLSLSGFSLGNLSNLQKLVAPASSICFETDLSGICSSLRKLRFTSLSKGPEVVEFFRKCTKLEALTLPNAWGEVFSALPLSLKKLRVFDSLMTENSSKFELLPQNLEFFYWQSCNLAEPFSLDGLPLSLHTLILDFRLYSHQPASLLPLASLQALRNLYICGWQHLSDVEGIPSTLDLFLACACSGLTDPPCFRKNLRFLRDNNITATFLETCNSSFLALLKDTRLYYYN
jgi:hypothetical protein